MSSDDKHSTLTVADAIAKMRNYPDGSYMRCPFCGCKSSRHEKDCAIEVVASAVSAKAPTWTEKEARYLYAARNALTAGDKDEAYHQIYWLVQDRAASPYEPWAEVEALANAPLREALPTPTKSTVEAIRDYLLNIESPFLEGDVNAVCDAAARSSTGPMALTPAMIVAGANVEPPCSAGEFIERFRAAIAAMDGRADG